MADVPASRTARAVTGLRLGLKPREVADLLGMSVRSVYRAIAAGEIPAERIAGCTVVPAAALVARFGDPVDLEVLSA